MDHVRASNDKIDKAYAGQILFRAPDKLSQQQAIKPWSRGRSVPTFERGYEVDALQYHHPKHFASKITPYQYSLQKRHGPLRDDE